MGFDDFVLDQMKRSAPTTPHDLAAQLGLTTDQLVRSMDRLIAAGRVVQHGYNGKGYAAFWLPYQLEAQRALEREAADKGGAA